MRTWRIAGLGLSVLAASAGGTIPATRAGVGPTYKPIRVTRQGSQVTVTLAPALRQAVQRYFPGFRAVTWADFTPALRRDLERGAAVNREVPQPFVPWAVIGDFDGNGRPEAALLLTRQRRQWRIVAFHQTAAGTFHPFVLEHGDGLRPSMIDDFYIIREPRQHLAYLGIPRTGRGQRVWAQWKHDAICEGL